MNLAACPSECSECNGVNNGGVSECTACKDGYILNTDECNGETEYKDGADDTGDNDDDDDDGNADCHDDD